MSCTKAVHDSSLLKIAKAENIHSDYKPASLHGKLGRGGNLQDTSQKLEKVYAKAYNSLFEPSKYCAK